jgi:hypothetical protein
MAQTVVQICNTALARIGVSNFISSIDEATQEAAVCKLLYEQCRDRLLREVHWPFARVFKALTLVEQAGSEPAWATEWAYAYRYPTDCLTIWRILTKTGRNETTPEPYDIGRDEQGRLLFTNQLNAIAEYTARVEDPAQFDSTFVSALAWLLAMEIAMPLSAMDNLRKQAMQAYMGERDQAARIAGNESEQSRDVDTEFLNARGYAANTVLADSGVAIYPNGFTIS